MYNIQGDIVLEFIKGNGKGKYYNFSGEYVDGKINGNVKEYDIYGPLIFDGQYVNGERNGKGKEYNEYGLILFDGEYLNGKRWN